MLIAFHFYICSMAAKLTLKYYIGLERDHFAYEAIDGMTKSKSADRISLSKAIEMLQ